MKLIEKLKEMFFEHELDVTERPPSHFDRLRNVFFSAEFLAADLDRVPPDCKCEDAIAHLDGSCCCTISTKESSKTGSTKGCAEQLERLQVDIKWVHEALKRGNASLDPGGETEELRREFTEIANAVEGLRLILEKLKAHIGEFQETCTNTALQRLKQTSIAPRRRKTAGCGHTPALSSLKSCLLHACASGPIKIESCCWAKKKA